MATHGKHCWKHGLMRLLSGLAAATALSGCAVYGPPYGVYDPAPVVVSGAPYYDAYPYGYGRPAYVGPPVSLNFGYYRHSYRGGYSGHGWHGGPRGHGWGGRRGGYGGGRGYGRR